MPLLPSSTGAEMLFKANGINDIQSVVKLPPGFVSFLVNMTASGDEYNRREGRDLFFMDSSGPVMGMASLTWDDGTTTNIGQIGSNIYNLTFVYTYLFNGGKLIIQSQDLNYWDVTPDPDTSLIFPTVVALPVTPPRASNLTVFNGESLAFKGTNGVTRLLCDQDHQGWYLRGDGISNGTTEFTSDVVFTYASGFSLRMVDYTGNTWKYSVSNAGEFIVTTV